MVAGGEAVVLLDALDELTETERGPARELVRSWAEQAGDRARCVITSRIAGYTGAPLPDAHEVELQAFTPDDVDAVIDAWRLPPVAAAQLRGRLRDPAVAAMARIPLLLALLCSLAARAAAREALPTDPWPVVRASAALVPYRAHRSLDDLGAPVLDDVEVEALLQILAPLAFAFATQPAGWTDLMPVTICSTPSAPPGRPSPILVAQANQVLRELSVGAGVLVPDGDPSAGRQPALPVLAPDGGRVSDRPPPGHPARGGLASCRRAAPVVRPGLG